MSARWTDEDAYAALADELNDGDPNQLTIDDFEPEGVAAGARYAAEHGLAWPPGTGDFDRYCERRWEAERREKARKRLYG
jgi:hypothetical protein